MFAPGTHVHACLQNLNTQGTSAERPRRIFHASPALRNEAENHLRQDSGFLGHAPARADASAAVDLLARARAPAVSILCHAGKTSDLFSSHPQQRHKCKSGQPGSQSVIVGVVAPYDDSTQAAATGPPDCASQTCTTRDNKPSSAIARAQLLFLARNNTNR